MAHVVGVPRRDPCHKCKLPVFLAERLAVGMKIYHRVCLKCARCSSQLTPGSFYETEVDDEYCCETCPDEEEIDGGASGSAVQLRNDSRRGEEATVAPAASPSDDTTKFTRRSIADRLAFFEKNKNGNAPERGASMTVLKSPTAGHRLLQKSVSDEEKTKSLQRLEGGGAGEGGDHAYDLPPALRSFLEDSLNADNDRGGVAQEGADSEPSSSLSPLTDGKSSLTPMDTSETEEEDDDNQLNYRLLPQLPRSSPPKLSDDGSDGEIPFGKPPPVPTTRFTAKAEIRLATTAKDQQREKPRVTFEDNIDGEEPDEQLKMPLDMEQTTTTTATATTTEPETLMTSDESEEARNSIHADEKTDEDSKAFVEIRKKEEGEEENEMKMKNDVDSLYGDATKDTSSGEAKAITKSDAETETKAEAEAAEEPITTTTQNVDNVVIERDDDIEAVTLRADVQEKEEDLEDLRTKTLAVNHGEDVTTTERLSFVCERLQQEEEQRGAENDAGTGEKLEGEGEGVEKKAEYPQGSEMTAKDDEQPETKTSTEMLKQPSADGSLQGSQKSSTKSDDDYPEDLNPFKSDDDDDDKDEEKENKLNPFDSSDDEIELEKPQNRRSLTTFAAAGVAVVASSTPNRSSMKVPPPRPPPPRISLNPFGDDDCNAGDDNDLTRRSSLSSSFSRKTPVPTPRSNLSQSGSGHATPEPTPRLGQSQRSPSQQNVLQSSSEYYGSANSLTYTPSPAGLQRNGDTRGSIISLASSSGGTVRSRKSRRAPAPPQTPVKELFPSTETVNSTASKASTPTSSTMGTPKSGRKKRPAPAPPKPARLEAASPLPEPEPSTGSKNSHNYPLQGEIDSPLPDEAKALLEGKTSTSTSATKSTPGGRTLIPLDAALLEDDGGGCGAAAGRAEEGSDVVYRRMIVPVSVITTPSRETNPLHDSLMGMDGFSVHDRQLEKMKDNKEAKNRNRQSQLSASSGAEDGDGGSFLYGNKSSHGKWKRRKGPAPALPVPPRKVLQMLPLQEIRHELDIIEVQQQGLEKQGVILEKMIRDRCEGHDGQPLTLADGQRDKGIDGGDGDGSGKPPAPENSKEVEDLILQLFELVNEKNELFRRQAELMYLRRQHRLEQEQADLEYEIRVLMAQPERNKTDTDKAREEALIAGLVEVVRLRNEVIESLEMDRLREAEEDLSIKQRLEQHSAKREAGGGDTSKKSSSKLSKKEKKQLKEAKKLGKSKKIDAEKDADESEINLNVQKVKKKKKFVFL